jgi:hypothetical protein
MVLKGLGHRLLTLCMALQKDWAIKAGLDLELSDSGFQDKREYHTILKRRHGLAVH